MLNGSHHSRVNTAAMADAFQRGAVGNGHALAAVTKDIPPNMIADGMPAGVVRTL